MAPEPFTTGEVITFYSYKGGTGRSMALANVATLLARRRAAGSRRVLVIDWDLEAPGQHHYFPWPPRPSAEVLAQKQDGLIELFITLDRHTSATTGGNALRGSSEHDRFAEDAVGLVKLTDYIRPTIVRRARPHPGRAV